MIATRDSRAALASVAIHLLAVAVLMLARPPGVELPAVPVLRLTLPRRAARDALPPPPAVTPPEAAAAAAPAPQRAPAPATHPASGPEPAGPASATGAPVSAGTTVPATGPITAVTAGAAAGERRAPPPVHASPDPGAFTSATAADRPDITAPHDPYPTTRGTASAAFDERPLDLGPVPAPALPRSTPVLAAVLAPAAAANPARSPTFRSPPAPPAPERAVQEWRADVEHRVGQCIEQVDNRPLGSGRTAAPVQAIIHYTMIVAADGAATAIELGNSSGYSEVDATVVLALRQCQFPPPPGAGSTTTFTGSVRFDLERGFWGNQFD